MFRTLLTAAVLLLSPFAAAPAFAHDYVIGDLTIDHPWARPTVTTRQPGAAYFTIRNDGDTDQRLIEARPINFAEAAELHTHINDDGVMRMRVVEGGVVIPAGETVSFQPGGLHVMLFGLEEPLTEGSPQSITLVFEELGEIDLILAVHHNSESGHGDH
jgi:copper(I)-binding protein